MIKRVNVIDRIDFNDDGSFKSVKGHVENIKVIEISELERKFSNHQFTKETLMEIHKSEWKLIDDIIDYCGG